MINFKDITTEKGFEIAELVVSLFSGALFIYLVDEDFFLDSEILKLVLLSVAIVLPLLVVVKFMIEDIYWKDEDQIKNNVRKSVDDEKCDEKRLEQMVDERFREKVHGASIRVASIIVTFCVCLFAILNLKWYHMELNMAIAWLYIVVMIIVEGVVIREKRRIKKEKAEK
jgi:Flp pilus assembly protein TadB